MLLSICDSDVFIFNNFKILNDKALRVVVTSYRIEQFASGYQASLSDVAFTKYELFCECFGRIWIVVKIANHAVNLYVLIDVCGDEPFKVSLFRKVLIVVESRLV